MRQEASFYGIPELMQLMDQQLATADRVIIVSVGGVEYQVTANTLRRAPSTSILVKLANDPDSFPIDHRVRVRLTSHDIIRF